MMQGHVCAFCKNVSPKSKLGNVFCKAFPNGVPEEIWSGNHSHNRPFEEGKEYYFFTLKKYS